jgi:GDPmannose 4,6-dehydratase
MSRAFITGVTGQDGSYLAERLVAEGWDVHGLVRRTPVENEQSVPNGVTVHEGDLLDAEQLDATLQQVEPDLIVNLAGVTSVAASWDDPLSTFASSGGAVATVLDSALRLQNRTGREVRVVQASSAEIFGNPAQDPQNEATPLAPVSPYGAAKAFAHLVVGVYRGRGLHASSAILYNHESPRRPPTFVTRKITQGAARIARGLQEELVLGNLESRRDWGWAPDYVDAIMRMAAADEPDDYVIATGITHSVREFVQAAFDAAGLGPFGDRVRVDAAFVRPADALAPRGDASAARTKMGWAPTREFGSIIQSMVDADLARIDGR